MKLNKLWLLLLVFSLMLSLSSCDIDGILGELNGIVGDSGDK